MSNCGKHDLSASKPCTFPFLSQNQPIILCVKRLVSSSFAREGGIGLRESTADHLRDSPHSPIESAFLPRWACRRGMSLPLHAQPLTSGCLLYHSFRPVPRNALKASSARSRCLHSMDDLALTDNDRVTIQDGTRWAGRLDTWKLRSEIGSGGSVGTCGGRREVG
jgi:hypothetical protein